MQLTFEQVKATKEGLKKSQKRRKALAIQQNDTQYKEESIEDLYDKGRFSKIDATIEDLLERNILNEDVRALKRKHEIQWVRLCEVIEQKKKAKEDKVMAEEDKRQIATNVHEGSMK